MKRRQQGALSLVLVIAFLLIGLLGLLGSVRLILMEERMIDAQLASAQARSAASTGMGWASHLLNSDRVDARCEAVEGPLEGFRFRETHLSIDASGWVDLAAGSRKQPWLAACAISAQGLHCACRPDENPADAALPSPQASEADDRGTQGFWIELKSLRRADEQAVGQILAPGIVQVRAHGCSRAQPACAEEGQRLHQGLAYAQQAQQFQLIKALRRGPSAPVVAGAAVSLVTADGLWPELWRTDGAGPAALIQARGTIDDSPLDLEPFASLQLLRGDTSVPSTPDAFFQHYFGMPLASYAKHGSLRRVRCPLDGDCGPTLSAQLTRGARMIMVDTVLHLNSPLTGGTPDAPALLILREGGVIAQGFQWWGLVYSQAPLWLSGDVAMQGALLAAEHLVLEGGVTLTHDATALALLQQQLGSFVPVAGSWSPVP